VVLRTKQRLFSTRCTTPARQQRDFQVCTSNLRAVDNVYCIPHHRADLDNQAAFGATLLAQKYNSLAQLQSVLVIILYELAAELERALAEVCAAGSPKCTKTANGSRSGRPSIQGALAGMQHLASVGSRAKWVRRVVLVAEQSPGRVWSKFPVRAHPQHETRFGLPERGMTKRWGANFAAAAQLLTDLFPGRNVDSGHCAICIIPFQVRTRGA